MSLRDQYFGPLLLLLYINDIKFVSDILQSIIFADDTSLFLSGKNMDTLCSTINTELKKIDTWFKANKLKIECTKNMLYVISAPKQKY